MSNLKKVLALALAFAMVLTVMVGAVPTYADQEDIVSKGDQTLMDRAVAQLGLLGIMQGVKEEYEDEDGTTTSVTNFESDSPFDRAMLARILYAIYNKGAVISETWNEKYDTVPFTDIAGSWAKGYIAYGYTMGLLSGTTEDGKTYEPTKDVTGYELASALVRVIGYTADDITVYPDDVYALGNTFDNRIFSLGANKSGTLYEIDGDAVITRANAAVMIYNAICVATTVKPASDYTVGNYIPTETTFIESVYEDYYYAKDAQIVAMGADHLIKTTDGKNQYQQNWDNQSDWEIDVKAEDGYIIYKYTTKAGDTSYYKQADADMKRDALLKSDEYELLGSYVDLIYYGGKVQLVSDPTNGYELVAVESQFADATDNTGLYTTLTLKDGDTTYSATFDNEERTNSTDYKFNGVAAFNIRTRANENDADVIYAVVSGTTIKEIIGVKTLDVGKIATVSGDNFTLDAVSAGGSTSNTYNNVTKSDDVAYAKGDYVLFNIVSQDHTAATSINNADIEHVLTKSNVTVTRSDGSGTVFAGDTKLAKATGSLGSTLNIVNPGYTYTMWTYNGMYYMAENTHTASSDAITGSNYLFTTTAGKFKYGFWGEAGQTGSTSTTGTYGYYTDVVFANNEAMTIVVSKVNNVDLTQQHSEALYARFIPKTETLYTYTKLANGTYELFEVVAFDTNGQVLNDYAGLGSLVPQTTAAGRISWTWSRTDRTTGNVTTEKISNDPIVFAKTTDNWTRKYSTPAYWVALDLSEVTSLGGATSADGYVVTKNVNGWRTPNVVVLDNAVAITNDTQPNEGVFYVRSTNASGYGDYMKYITLNAFGGTSEFADGAAGSDTTFTVTDAVNDFEASKYVAGSTLYDAWEVKDQFGREAGILGDLKAGDVVHVEYANETSSMIRWYEVNGTLLDGNDAITIVDDLADYAKYAYLIDNPATTATGINTTTNTSDLIRGIPEKYKNLTTTPAAQEYAAYVFTDKYNSAYDAINNQELYEFAILFKYTAATTQGPTEPTDVNSFAELVAAIRSGETDITFLGLDNGVNDLGTANESLTIPTGTTVTIKNGYRLTATAANPMTVMGKIVVENNGLFEIDNDTALILDGGTIEVKNNGELRTAATAANNRIFGAGTTKVPGSLIISGDIDRVSAVVADRENFATWIEKDTDGAVLFEKVWDSKNIWNALTAGAYTASTEDDLIAAMADTTIVDSITIAGVTLTKNLSVTKDTTINGTVVGGNKTVTVAADTELTVAAGCTNAAFILNEGAVLSGLTGGTYANTLTLLGNATVSTTGGGAVFTNAVIPGGKTLTILSGALLTIGSTAGSEDGAFIENDGTGTVTIAGKVMPDGDIWELGANNSDWNKVN